MLPDEFQRRLVDVNVNGLTDDDLAWADVAFIGAMAVQRESVKQIFARCQATGLKVVAGGPLFTAEPDAFKEVAHLILDEAELTLPSFLEDFKNGDLKKIYRASGFCDLYHTPPPSWDLIDMKKYASNVPVYRYREALLSALTAIRHQPSSNLSILSKKAAS
jgi:radical SAM superfamily enzyme YgiQ (UPF0313 family)